MKFSTLLVTIFAAIVVAEPCTRQSPASYPTTTIESYTAKTTKFYPTTETTKSYSTTTPESYPTKRPEMCTRICAAGPIVDCGRGWVG